MQNQGSGVGLDNVDAGDDYDGDENDDGDDYAAADDDDDDDDADERKTVERQHL